VETEGDQLVKDAETNQASQDKATQDYVGGGTDQAEAFANDPKNASGSNPGSAGNDQDGGRFSQLANAAKAGASYLAGNKKKLGAGGGIIGIIAAALFGFSSLLPLKLLHIEQNMFNHIFQPNQRTEARMASKLMRGSLSMFDKDGRYKIKGRGFFGNKWATFSLDRFEASLAEKGVKLNFDPASKELVSIERNGIIENTKGLPQGEKLGRLASVVNENVPPWRVGQRVKLIRLMTARYGVSFKFFTNEKFKTAAEYLKDRFKKIQNGASAAEVAAAKGTTPETTAADVKAAAAAADESTSVVKRVFGESGDIKLALREGAKSVFNSKTAGAIGIVAIICTIQQLANDALANGYDIRAKQLMRTGGALLSSAAQLRKGETVDPQTLNYLMETYVGDPAATTVDQQTGKTIPTDDTKDFTQSADWKRATNQPVTSGDVELSAGANPDGKTGLATIMATINSITGAAGGLGDKVCSLILSPLGTFLSIVELVANIFIGGSEAIASNAAKLTLQAALMIKVVPTVLASASGLAITGTENAVQQIAMSGTGMEMMAHDYGRASGSAPISDQAYTTLAMAADQEQAIADRGKGIYFNVFSTENPRSMISRLIDQSPSSPQSAIASLSGSFFNIRQVFSNHLLALINPVYADTSSYANPNKLQRYGFTDAEIAKYDIADTYDASGKMTQKGLKSYFEDTVITTAAGTPASRIDILGNPDGYHYGNQDENKNDVLHCFVNSYSNPYSVTTEDPVCLNIGYLTQTDTVKPATEAEYQAGIQANVYNPWCVANLAPKNPPPCPQAAADEMLRYRLYLGYQHIANEFLDMTMTDAESKAAGESLDSPYQTNTPASTPASGPTTTGASGSYSWPVGVPGSSVVSCFGPRSGTIHPGDDIAKPLNSPVYASQAGTVAFEGPMSGYGSNFVIIDHGGGTYTSYGHMNGATVKAGQTVTQGQQIGVVGSQGQSQGPHVHFNLFIGGKSWIDGINGNVEPLTHGLALPAGVPISGSNCAGIK